MHVLVRAQLIALRKSVYTYVFIIYINLFFNLYRRKDNNIQLTTGLWLSNLNDLHELYRAHSGLHTTLQVNANSSIFCSVIC